jgi:hypothetical protein
MHSRAQLSRNLKNRRTETFRKAYQNSRDMQQRTKRQARKTTQRQVNQAIKQMKMNEGRKKEK